jgi:hypothetical protein
MADLTGMMQAAAGGAGGDANYIEDVFSTYLYTGTGASLNIVNNIDLSTEGGLVWIKDRDSGAKGHALFDTARGVNKKLQTQSTAAEFSGANQLTAFNTNGFNLGSDTDPNGSGTTYVSWTFRKQPKFFDVVTWTGTGSNRTIAHNLGSVPGCIIVKRTDTTADWAVYHRSLANTQYMVLNSTAAVATGATWWNSTTPTDAVFSLGTEATVNASGGTYVAYVLAHDAGGFGLAGTDNVITCGSFVSDASGGFDVSLGWEPQWVMQKVAIGASNQDWKITDTFRGMTASPSSTEILRANTSGAASPGQSIPQITATGFFNTSGGTTASATHIYIAIRRGPMAVPELGTTVFTPVTATPGGSAATVTTNITTDLIITAERSHALSGQTYAIDRLRGSSSSDARFLATQSTAAEAASAGGFTFSSPANIAVNDNLYPASGITNPVIYWFFSRAPGFFDEVCYTGNDTGTRILDHNLAVFPELVIVKKRSGSLGWAVQASTFTAENILFLNTTAALTSTASYLSYPEQNTSTTFKVRYNLNVASDTYVAYLFATCPGVSKVGSYTGTAATQVINCGFTTGARFVLIKRTDSTGDWYVWDSARGIIAGDDPYLLLNSTAAEVTNTDYVDTAATGFELTSTAPAAINASGGSYIFLAIS